MPFFVKSKEQKNYFQKTIKKSGIEYRPLISGNLLRQPFLKSYYKNNQFINSEFIHENAFYIGNNQFVNKNRLKKLFKLMKNFFFKKIYDNSEKNL